MAIVKLNKSFTDINTALAEGLDNQPKQNYVWDDWSFSISGTNVNKNTSKPDFDQDEISYTFDDTDEETIYGSGISSHKFKLGVAGLEWHPHVHWIQKAAGTVIWQLTYRLTAADSQESGTWTTITTTASVFTYSSGSLHQITTFPAIDASGFTSTAFILDFKLSRINAGNTYTGDAFFKSFDIHVPIDQDGSREEFIK